MYKTVPFVSVLIVNYNGKEFIAECLDSVLQSDYPKFEIVLVDNGSTDQSVNYITKRYKEELRSKKIRLIQSKTNFYFTGGSNLAAKHAKGEKLIFLNSDTVVTTPWIRELVKCQQNESRCLIQPKILFYSKKNNIDNAGGRYIFPGFGFGIARGEENRGQYDQTREVDFANGTCFMINKDFFLKLGRFDDWYRFQYEDVDLCLRAKKSGAKIFACGKSTVYHKVGLTFKKSIPKEILLFHLRKNRLRTVIKNFSGIEKMLRLFLLGLLYGVFILQDILSLKKQRMLTTIRSIYLVNQYEQYE